MGRRAGRTTFKAYPFNLASRNSPIPSSSSKNPLFFSSSLPRSLNDFSFLKNHPLPHKQEPHKPHQSNYRIPSTAQKQNFCTSENDKSHSFSLNENQNKRHRLSPIQLEGFNIYPQNSSGYEPKPAFKSYPHSHDSTLNSSSNSPDSTSKLAPMIPHIPSYSRVQPPVPKFTDFSVHSKNASSRLAFNEKEGVEPATWKQETGWGPPNRHPPYGAEQDFLQLVSSAPKLNKSHSKKRHFNRLSGYNSSNQNYYPDEAIEIVSENTPLILPNAVGDHSKDYIGKTGIIRSHRSSSYDFNFGDSGFPEYPGFGSILPVHSYQPKPKPSNSKKVIRTNPYSLPNSSSSIRYSNYIQNEYPKDHETYPPGYNKASLSNLVSGYDDEPYFPIRALESSSSTLLASSSPTLDSPNSDQTERVKSSPKELFNASNHVSDSSEYTIDYHKKTPFETLVEAATIAESRASKVPEKCLSKTQLLSLSKSCSTSFGSSPVVLPHRLSHSTPIPASTPPSPSPSSSPSSSSSSSSSTSLLPPSQHSSSLVVLPLSSASLPTSPPSPLSPAVPASTSDTDSDADSSSSFVSSRLSPESALSPTSEPGSLSLSSNFDFLKPRSKTSTALGSEKQNEDGLLSNPNSHEIWDVLHISQKDYLEAVGIYEKVKQNRMVQSRRPVQKKTAIIASILFIICRNRGYPRTFTEICNACKVTKRDIGMYYKLMQKVLDPELTIAQSAKPEEFMKRWCTILKVPDFVSTVASEIYYSVDKLNLVPGKCPIGVSAACIWLTIWSSREFKSLSDLKFKLPQDIVVSSNGSPLLYNEANKLHGISEGLTNNLSEIQSSLLDINQKDVCKVASVASATLTATFKMLLNNLVNILPEDFSSHFY